MPPTVRLRSRRQTTGPQGSTRLLKRPGERPGAAKPRPSEQGLPLRRKPGAKLRSRRSARQQRRLGSKPSSERSVKLPRRRSATLREKPSARRRGRQSAKLPGSRRWRLPHRQNAKLRRRSRPSGRLKIREVGEPAKSEVAAKPESGEAPALQLALRWLGGRTQPRRSASCSACPEHFARRGSDYDRTS